MSRFCSAAFASSWSSCSLNPLTAQRDCYWKWGEIQAALPLDGGETRANPHIRRKLPCDAQAKLQMRGGVRDALGGICLPHFTTAPHVCEIGTRNIIGAVDPASPARIIVVTAFGIGDTRDRPPFMFKLFYRLILREHMADKERQEAVL